MDYYEKHLSHPTSFPERRCPICKELFTPLYFDNKVCHECREKGIRGKLSEPKDKWMI